MTYREKAEKAMKNGVSRNLTPKYVVFEKEGESIIGLYLCRSLVSSLTNSKDYYQYMFESDMGLIKFHLGSATDGEAGSLMKVGTEYYIEFLGKESLKGGKCVNKYHIEEIPDEEEPPHESKRPF